MSTVEVRVPQGIGSAAEATVHPWNKNVGDTVMEGEMLVELESEKVISEVVATATGVLSRIDKAEGTIVRAGDLLAVLESHEVGDLEMKGKSGAVLPIKVVTSLNESAVQSTVLPWKKEVEEAVQLGEGIVKLKSEKMVIGVVAPASDVLSDMTGQDEAFGAPSIQPDEQGSSNATSVEVKPSQLAEGAEAIVHTWKKKVGDRVVAGELLVEIESEKVVIEILVPTDGVLLKIGKSEGASVGRDDVVAIIAGPDNSANGADGRPHPISSTSTVAADASRAASEFDVIVIGSGPGGYIAAIRAAQLGMRVACIEKRHNKTGKLKLGGTCLNIGCIPSKALLASSEQYEMALHHLKDHGVNAEGVSLDLPKMLARKEAVVEKITSGVEFLFRKNKVSFFDGHGRLAGQMDGKTRVEVENEQSTKLLVGTNVIIATGSKARHLLGVPVDNRIIADSEGALSFDTVPRRLAVIGSGVIGLELGSVWRRLGAQVTILEALPDFLAAVDTAVAIEAAKQFKAQKLEIHLGVKIGRVDSNDRGVSIAYTDKDGNAQTLDADRLILSIGRIPYTEDLGLESVDLKANERGFIDVDDNCATKTPNIYAVGDVVRGPMLAHKAEDEGVLVAEVIAGQKPHINYGTIPWVIYTEPEIAWVGKTEQELKAEGRNIRAGKFPMTANGRAMGMNKTIGFVKVIADAETYEILGVHVISANASDMIAEAVVAMEFKASSEDIGRICHPHPSLSEAMREAALAVQKRALNM